MAEIKTKDNYKIDLATFLFDLKIIDAMTWQQIMGDIFTQQVEEIYRRHVIGG